MDRGRAALLNDDDDINADAGVVWRMATVATTNAMRRWSESEIRMSNDKMY